MLLTVPSWSSGVTFISEGSYVQQLASAFAGTHLESLCELDIDSPPLSHRMSAIICTIGPACRTVEMLEKMMHAGMAGQTILVIVVDTEIVEFCGSFACISPETGSICMKLGVAMEWGKVAL